MSRFLIRNFELLEPYEGKLSRTVLRGGSGSNAADLLDKGVYDFYKGDNWTYNIGIGYRKLFMDMYMKNDLGWAKETDHYSGPYFAIRAKFSSSERWTYVKRKDRK